MDINISLVVSKLLFYLGLLFRKFKSLQYLTNFKTIKKKSTHSVKVSLGFKASSHSNIVANLHLFLPAHPLFYYPG